MPYKRNYSNRYYSRPSSSYYGRALKRRSKKRTWGGGFAGYRKAAMGSFMRNLWQTYPAKPSAELLAAREQAGPVSISGLGDYEFTPGGSHSVGSRVGAWLGDKAQSFLGKITGLGDYSVMKNTLVNDPPSVRNNSARTVTLSHREYIGDVITGAAGSFDLKAYKIQPGDPSTFPWLSTIASQFQQYTLDGMIFQFKSMSADALNSTNTALGQVIMATNYNVSAPLFDSKYEMENTEFSSSVKPSCSAMHPIECARRESTLNELYVAAGGSIPGGKDPSFYDFGNFQIATNGFQAANVNIGELWVTYEITLLKPILNDINGSGTIWSTHYRSTGMVTPSSGTYYVPWQGLIPTPAPDAVHNLELEFKDSGPGIKGDLVTIKKIGTNLPFPVGTMFLVTVTSDGQRAGMTPVIASTKFTYEQRPGLNFVPNVVNPKVDVNPNGYSLRSGVVTLGGEINETYSAVFVTTSQYLLPEFKILGALSYSQTSPDRFNPSLVITVTQIREDEYDELI